MAAVPAQSFCLRGSRTLPAVGLGAVLVGAGVFLRERGEAANVWWSCLGCGFVWMAWFGSPLWRRSPVLWFDDAGLRARLPGFGVVAWAEIERVHAVAVGRRTFLLVERTAAAQRQRRTSAVLRALGRPAKAVDLAVPIDGLQATPAQVVAVVLLAWQHATGLANTADAGPSAPR